MAEGSRERATWLKPRQLNQIRIIAIAVLILVFVVLDFFDLGSARGPSSDSSSQSPGLYRTPTEENGGNVVESLQDPSKSGKSRELSALPVTDVDQPGDAANAAGNDVSSEETGRVQEFAEEDAKPPPVIWRDAPWKPEVGLWFTQCGMESEPITMEEVVHGKRCPAECNGNGICNYELGECRCRSGYNGTDCSIFDDHPCNLDPWDPANPSRWIVSICAGMCDNRTGQCFCGPDSSYPHRPLVEPCGIRLDPTSTGMIQEANSLYSTSESNPGWCNTNPEKVQRGEATPILTCHCAVDGYGGFFCDEKSRAYCLGGCNNHGHCHSGYCECRDGWYGIDCSIPSAETPPEDPPPPWLQVDTFSGTDQPAAARHLLANLDQSEGTDLRSFQSEANRACEADGKEDLSCEKARDGVTGGEPTAEVGSRAGQVGTTRRRLAEADEKTVVRRVERRRPLIYIYDLPGVYTYHHLEGRQIRSYCVPWMYTPNNDTEYTDNLYGMEPAVLEALLASPHRTTNPEEADYFYMPVLTGCIVARADDSPRMDMQTNHDACRPWLVSMYVTEAYEYVRDSYPYWNRSEGRDHIWMFPWDEGACYAPQVIWNSIMLSPWGNTMSKHGEATTAYLFDEWNKIPLEVHGGHPCFDPEKDIVMPSLKSPNVANLANRVWARPYEERNTLFYFSGQLGAAYEGGRPEAKYSMGIRQTVARLFGSSPDLEGKLGERTEAGVIVQATHTFSYSEELSRSRFCGVFPGDGFSARMEDSILHGCIPVIIQDGIQLPYENVLDYRSFAVRIAEDQIPEMISILKGISEERVRSMLQTIQSIWQRWYYHSVLKTEAERQRMWHDHIPDWGVEIEKLQEDDAIATLMQILYYKLYNDPWRKDPFGVSLSEQKKHGLGPDCKMQ